MSNKYILSISVKSVPIDTSFLYPFTSVDCIVNVYSSEALSKKSKYDVILSWKGGIICLTGQGSLHPLTFTTLEGAPKLDIDSGKIVLVLTDLQQNEKVIEKFIYQK